jgi:hypothetical protein
MNIFIPPENLSYVVMYMKSADGCVFMNTFLSGRRAPAIIITSSVVLCMFSNPAYPSWFDSIARKLRPSLMSVWASNEGEIPKASLHFWNRLGKHAKQRLSARVEAMPPGETRNMLKHYLDPKKRFIAAKSAPFVMGTPEESVKLILIATDLCLAYPETCKKEAVRAARINQERITSYYNSDQYKSDCYQYVLKKRFGLATDALARKDDKEYICRMINEVSTAPKNSTGER